MSNHSVCPNCGGHMFMATITRPGIVETTDSDGGFKILKEVGEKYEINVVKCARCKTELSEKDLVSGVTCSACGKVVNPSDIIDGVCSVCNAIKQRAELASASKEDIIRMLLEAEKKANPVVAKVEKQIEKAAEAEQLITVPVTNDSTITDTDATSATEEVTENVTEEVVEEATPKKRRSRRKATDVVEDSTEDVTEDTAENTESNVPEEVDEQAVETIADSQEAPFPDMPELNTEEVTLVETSEAFVPAETPVPVDNDAIGANFKMFDDTEDAF